jgi:hypothetical protein
VNEDQRDQVRAVIADAFYDARNAGRTMTDAAIDARDRVLSLLEAWGWRQV